MTKNKLEIPALLSELLLLRAATGSGLENPFPATPGMVFTSALPAESHEYLKEAERDFVDWCDTKTESKAEELRNAETLLELNPSNKLVRESIRSLKFELSKVSAITWRDVDSSKSSIIDILKRSSHNSIAFVDECSTKIATSSSNAHSLSSYFGWTSLTGNSSDATIIRSAVSGGALIHSLAGNSKPTFYHFSSVKEERAESLIHKTTKLPCADPVKGMCIVIPGPPHAKSTYSKDDVYNLILNVFVKGGSPSKVKVLFESEDLKKKWLDFINWDVSFYYAERMTKSRTRALETMPASLMSMALFSSQAALVAACLEEGSNSTYESITLKKEHLDLAAAFSRHMFNTTSGFCNLDLKYASVERARESFCSDMKVEEASASLTRAIEESITRLIPHNTAVRLEGVTAGLIDILLKRDDKFTKVTQFDKAQGMGKTKLAYTLSDL